MIKYDGKINWMIALKIWKVRRLNWGWEIKEEKKNKIVASNQKSIALIHLPKMKGLFRQFKYHRGSCCLDVMQCCTCHMKSTVYPTCTSHFWLKIIFYIYWNTKSLLINLVINKNTKKTLAISSIFFV
jgi:hypothetical protein